MKPDTEQDLCLNALVTIHPDPERAARTRQRCRAIIDRRAPAGGSLAGAATRRAEAPTGSEAAVRKALAGACCVLCVVYILALAFATVGLQGMSR
jgi:hypothetical protein